MQHRKNATILGLLYIIAAVTSVIAVVLYGPIMNDTWYEVAGNNQQTGVLLGVLNDVLLVVSVVGTTVVLAPYLKPISPRLSLAYFSFRYMEAVFLAVGLVAILGLVYLSGAYADGLITNVDSLNASGVMLQGFHRWTMVLGPNFMLGINTIIYSYLLYKSELVPKGLAAFGMIVSVMVFVAGLLDFLGIIEPWSTMKGIVSLPLGVYEISLAIYLIFKGFKMDSIIFSQSKSDITSALS